MMNKPLWIFPVLLLTILLANSAITQAMLTGDQFDISHYECVDENGDEACDEPPED